MPLAVALHDHLARFHLRALRRLRRRQHALRRHVVLTEARHPLVHRARAQHFAHAARQRIAVLPALRFRRIDVVRKVRREIARRCDEICPEFFLDDAERNRAVRHVEEIVGRPQMVARHMVELESVPLGLGSKDPDFLAASPFGKIPALRDGDFTLADSTAIITYLEALHPEPNLIPADPKARARTIWFDEFADTIHQPVAVKFFAQRFVRPVLLKEPCDEAIVAQGEAEMPAVLDYLEGVIPPSGFLVEDRLTLADIAVCSPFVNLDHVDVRLDAARHPKLVAYVQAILARPSFSDWVVQEKALVARLTA